MIKLFEQYNETIKIKQWLDDMKVKNYTINDDLTIDVDGNVELKYIDLTELPFKFNNISGDFDLYRNCLTTLKGCPEYVGKSFICTSNELTSLEYCPKYVGGDFLAGVNKLTTLEYLPNQIGGNFYCHTNQITTLKHISKEISGYIFLTINKLPKEISEHEEDLDLIKSLIKHQSEYGIWNSDNSLNVLRWDIFFKDFRNNLLN